MFDTFIEFLLSTNLLLCDKTKYPSFVSLISISIASVQFYLLAKFIDSKEFSYSNEENPL